MYMKRTPTLANKGSRKREPHKLVLKTWRTLETRLIVQQCAQQHILLNYVCMQTKKGDKTVEFLTKEPRMAENMVGTKNTNNCKTRISSTPAEHDRGLFIQFVKKLRHPWPSENVETQKLSHTEGRKITSTLTKCLDRADTSQNTEAFTSPVVLSRLVC